MKTRIFEAVSLIAIIAFCACKKTQDTKINVAITAISPDSGAYSTVVTISGLGFSTNASSNIVKFNGKNAVVQSASSTQMVVLVPQGAGTGPVTIGTNNVVTGPVFNYIFTYTVSTLAGSGQPGYVDGNGSSAEFYYPFDVALDTNGNVYVADAGNSRIRKITPSGVVSSLAGGAAGGKSDGIGSAAGFRSPVGITLDAQGNVYVADEDNNNIRKITSSGSVITIAGNFIAGHVDGSSSIAEFNNPSDIVLDATGNMYISEFSGNDIRRISSDGSVSTVAGNGTGGYLDGNGLSAEFNEPSGIAIDKGGNLYVADYLDGYLRKISQAGQVSSVGSYQMYNIALDSAGNIYVAGNKTVIKISKDGSVQTIADNSSVTNFNGTISGIAVDALGNVYIAGTFDNKIYKIIAQ